MTSPTPLSEQEIKKRNVESIMYFSNPAPEPEHQELICGALYKLPNEVLEKFDEIEPQFIVVEKGLIGMPHCIQKTAIISKRETNTAEDNVFDGRTWLIILNESELERLTLEEQHSAIIEELAHVYLGHMGSEVDMQNYTGDYRKDDIAEREAAALMKSWGIEYISMERLKKYRATKK